MASPRSPVMELLPNDGPADADLAPPAIASTRAVPVASAVPVTPLVAQPTLAPVNAAEQQYSVPQQHFATHPAPHQNYQHQYQQQQQQAYPQQTPVHQPQQPALHHQQAFAPHQAHPQQQPTYYQPLTYQSPPQQQQVQQQRTSASAYLIPPPPPPTTLTATPAPAHVPAALPSRTAATTSGPAWLPAAPPMMVPPPAVPVSPYVRSYSLPVALTGPGAGIPPPPTASVAPSPALRAASPTRRAPPTHMHSTPAMWTPAVPVNTAAVVNIQPGTAMPPPPTQAMSWAPPKPAPDANAQLAGHYVGPMMGNSSRVYQQGDSQTTLVDDMSGSWVAKMSKAVSGSVTAVFDKVWSGAPVAASTIHQAVGNVKSTAAAHAPAGFLSTTRGKSPRPEAGDRLV
ncbi:hypothetical protein GGF31_003732 [Allomyces arbusculus]|nr:hypothetical protein GGF31_003732 [Allomyces arbusculus]